MEAQVKSDHAFTSSAVLTNNLSWTELRGLDLKTGLFTLRQIKAATKNFDAENKLGEGGFGAVYKVMFVFGSLFFWMSDSDALYILVGCLENNLLL